MTDTKGEKTATPVVGELGEYYLLYGCTKAGDGISTDTSDDDEDDSEDEDSEDHAPRRSKRPRHDVDKLGAWVK